MEVKKSELLKVLNRLKPFFTTKSVSPLLECLYFDDEVIKVYDGRYFITVSDSPLKGLKGSVKSLLFLKIIENMPDEIIKIEVDTTLLRFKSGRATAKLNILLDEYFSFDTNNIEWQSEIPIQLIMDGIDKALISTSEIRPDLNGIMIEVKNKRVQISSTDSESMAIIDFTNTVDSPDFKEFMPKVFCERLLQLVKEFNQGMLKFSKDYIMCEFETTNFISPIEQVTLRDLNKICTDWGLIGHDAEHKIEVLKDAVDRNYMINTQMSKVANYFKLEFTDIDIKITSEDSWGHMDEIIEYSLHQKVKTDMKASLLKTLIDYSDTWDFKVMKETGIWSGHSSNAQYQFNYHFLSTIKTIEEV